MAANNSYEQAVALIAAANRVVQDPNSVGAALRTISLRLRGTSVKELEEAGEDTTGAVESTSKLRSKVKSLSGVDILTDTGAYKDTYTILLEISKVWDDMNDLDQAALLELLAGKTRSNTLAAILGNQKDLEAAYEAAQNAEGSALRENEKYLDSIQGRMDKFNNAVQTMWKNTLDDDTVKWFVDVGTWLVKFIDSLGLIKTLVTTIMGYFIYKNTDGAGLSGILFGKSGSADATVKTLEKLKKEYEDAKAVYRESGSDKDRQRMKDAENNYNTYREENKSTLDKVDEQNTLKENLDSLYQKREQMQQELATAKKDLTDMASQGLQQDVADYISLDTTQIDDQIDGVESKLEKTYKRLEDAKAKTRDDYAMMGSKTPSKDKHAYEDAIRSEIDEYKKELKDLKATKDDMVSKGIDSYVGDLREEFDATNTEIDTTIGKIAQLDGELGRIGKIDKLKGKFKENIIPKQIDELVAKREQLRQELSNLATDAGIEVDTADIDAKIAEAQAKVDELTRKVEEAKALTEDDYAATGSEDPKADRNNRIQQATQELEDYKKKLNELTVERDKLIAQQVPDILPDGSEVQPEIVKQKIAELNNIIDRLQRELDELRAKFGVVGAEGVKTGNKLTGAFKKVGKSVGQYAEAMLEAYAMTAMIDLLKKAWDGLMGWINGLQETPEEIMDEFNELNDELSRTKSELNSLESELENTNDRIEELMKQGTLSFVEQEELDRLQERSSELERQISLQDALTDAIQKSVNAQAVKAGGSFLNTSFYSEKTKTERQQEAKESGETWGTAAGMALGLAVSLIPGVNIGALALMGVGAMAGGAIGGEIGSASAGAAYDSEQTVMEAISTMQYDYIKLQAKQDATFEAYTQVMAKEDVTAEERQNAENRYIDAINNSAQWQANMGEAMQQLQAIYNSIDWETATTSQKQQKISIGKDLAKYAVTVGSKGSKNAAIDFLLDDNVGGKELRERIERAIEQAAESGKDFDIYELLGDDEEIQKLDEQLREMGLTLVDVKYKFLDAADGAAELAETKFENNIRQIETILDKLQLLKDAFSEWSDDGFVSPTTLQDIAETFGNIPELEDAYNTYMHTVNNPSATPEQVESATEELAEAHIGYTIDKEGLDDPRTYNLLMSGLKKLGVTNAESFLTAVGKKKFAEDVANQGLYYSDDDKLMQRQYDESGKEIAPIETSLEKYLGNYATEEDKEMLRKTIMLQDAHQTKEHFKEVKQYYDDAKQTYEEIDALVGDINLMEGNLVDLQNKRANLSADTYDQYGIERVDHGISSDSETTVDKLMDAYVVFDYVYTDSSGVLHRSSDLNEIISTASADMDNQIVYLQDLLNQHQDASTNLHLGQAWLWSDFQIEYWKGDIEEKIDDKESEIDFMIQEGNEYLNELYDDQGLVLDLDLTGDFGEAGRMFDEYTAKMQTLASIQSEMGNSFTISAQKLREFAATYPELLSMIESTSNGQMKMNADMVNAFLEGERAMQNATIDTKINSLKGDQEVVSAKIKFAEAQIAIAQAAAQAGTDADWEAAQDKITASNIALGYLINNGVDEEIAYETVTKNMSEDSEEFQGIVQQVASDNYQNLDMSADGAADSMADNAKAMQNSLMAITRQAHEAARAVSGVGEGEVLGSTEMVSGVTYGKRSKPLDLVNTVEDFDTGETSEKVEPGEPINLEELYGSLIDPEAYQTPEEYIAAQEAVVAVLQDVYDYYGGQISILEALKNTPLSDFDPNSSSGGGDDRLANLQKKYEGIIKNLENQKSWLENEISREEEIGLGVSKSYYEEQIKLNDKLLKQYDDQKQDLIDLRKEYPEGSEEWYEVSEAIWDMDFAIQELTADSIKASKSIVDLFVTAFDKIGEAFDDKLNISDAIIGNIDGYMELLDLEGDTATKGLFDLKDQELNIKLNTQTEKFNDGELIAQAMNKEYNDAQLIEELYTKQQNGEVIDTQLLQDLQAQYEDLPTPGTDAWKAWELSAEQAIIDVHAQQMEEKQNLQDIRKEILQNKEAYKELYFQRLDELRAAYDNRDKYYEDQLGYVDQHINRYEAMNANVPDDFYEARIDIQETANAAKWEQYWDARQQQIEIEKEFGADSQEYLDAYFKVNELHAQWQEGETKVLEDRKKIIDNHFDRFNQAMDRFDHSTSQLKNISSLIEDEDVATEDGEWTAEGLTRLGIEYQNMSRSKVAIEELNDEIAYWDDLLAQGQITEKEHAEKTQGLTDQLWDQVNAYESSEDAIVDLNESRIDMIEEGINKEIEAYEELIDLKKEALDAERDLYEFKKDVEKQTKDIAALERRIASMSGSTDAATIAERTKLEAQLREANESLDDTYYGHAMDSQSKALDDEIEAFTKNGEDYIEGLRESIKDVDLLIETTMSDVVSNGQVVLETLYGLSETYKFPLDTNLVYPWINATQKSLDFETAAITHYNNIKFYVDNNTSALEKSLGTAYGNLTVDAKGNPLYEFSEYAKEASIDNIITYADQKWQDVSTSITKGFTESQDTIQGWGTTASNAVQSVIDKFTDEETGLIAALNKTADRINSMPHYDGGYTDVGGGSGSGGSGGGGTGGVGNSGGSSNNAPAGWHQGIENLHVVLAEEFGQTDLGKYGYWGPKTEAALKRVQQDLKNRGWTYINTDGLWKKQSLDVFYDYFDSRINDLQQSGNGSSMVGQGVQQLKKYRGMLPAAYFAKGTLGTTKDQFAITDESWIGEEITLAAGKNGQLQYLKKGSAVMPADISANLVEWGKLNPNMMSFGDMSGGVQILSNYVNKPEIKLDIENFLNVGTVSKDTLPELEKLMDRKIDTFAKQLNASIRKFK